MKKRKGMFALLVVVIGIIGLFFYYSYSKPAPFPTEEALKKDINQTFPEASVKIIQDIIHVDERHKVVPFISLNKDYGLSYWIWKKNKWRVAEVDNREEPMIWKIEEGKRPKYVYVWNIFHKNKVDSFTFYLTRQRDYITWDRKGLYIPPVQMTENVRLHNKTYGVFPIPEDWATIIDYARPVQMDWLFSNEEDGDSLNYGWRPNAKPGVKEPIDFTNNGESFSTGDIILRFPERFEKGSRDLYE